MVKLNYSSRIKDLKLMIIAGKRVNKDMSKMQVRLIELEKKQRKGNESLIRFN